MQSLASKNKLKYVHPTHPHRVERICKWKIAIRWNSSYHQLLCQFKSFLTSSIVYIQNAPSPYLSQVSLSFNVLLNIIPPRSSMSLSGFLDTQTQVFNENSLLKSFLPFPMWTKVSHLLNSRWCIIVEKSVLFIQWMDTRKFFFINHKFLILFDFPKINKRDDSFLWDEMSMTLREIKLFYGNSFLRAILCFKVFGVSDVRG